MANVFLGSEALARGDLTRGQLRWNYRPIYRDVYMPKHARTSLQLYTHAAWLWSRRRGVITGRAAAAMYGAKWIDEYAPVEVIGGLHHPPAGIIVRRDRIADDEVVEIDGLAVATTARTALDFGRHLARGIAVAHLDALSRASALSFDAVESLIARYHGGRGMHRCRTALSLVDSGAQSPKETWLRLLLIDGGLPRPTTQIPVLGDDGRPFAYLDMGWPDVLVAVEYDGDQHRTDRGRYVKDIRRLDRLQRMGWIVIRVVAEDRRAYILARVRDALAHRRASLPSRL